MEERISKEDIAWSHYRFPASAKGHYAINVDSEGGVEGTLSLSNASLTGFAVRVAGVEGVCGDGGSSAIV